jgi:hypothetical protein
MKRILLLFFLSSVQIVFAQAPNWIWTKVASTDISSSAPNMRIAVDKFDNVYETGYMYGNVYFDSYTLSAGTGAYLVKCDAAGNVKWALVNQGGTALGYGVTTDADANVYITGNFTASIIFGSHILSSIGGNDAYVVKFDSLGNTIWAKTISGSLQEFGQSIVADSTGNIYVSGTFTSHVLSAGSLTLNNPGNGGIYVAKFDSSGNAIWIKGGLSSTGSSYDNQLSIDRNSNLYLAGSFSTSFIFDTYTLTSSGNYDIYLVKYDSAGSVLWARKGGGTSQDRNNNVTTDELVNVYITGYYNSAALTFNSTTLTNTNTTTYDGYLVKYDSMGNVKWAKTISDSLSSSGMAVAVSQNKVYLTGSFGQPEVVHIDTMTLATPPVAMYPMFFSALDTSGIDLFAKAIGAGGEEQSSIALSTNPECIYLGGSFNNTVLILGPDTLIIGLGGKGNPFVSKLCYGEVGLSINETMNRDMLSVYPNPVTSTLTLETTNPLSTITIYSADGREIKIVHCQLSTVNLDVRDLSAGIYFLDCIGEKERSMVKVVKY